MYIFFIFVCKWFYVNDLLNGCVGVVFFVFIICIKYCDVIDYVIEVDEIK